MVTNTKLSGTPSSLRKVHRMLALKNLLFENHCSRKSLAEDLGISSMAMTRISNDFLNGRIFVL